MMEEPPREMSVQWNKKIMGKLEIMRILVGKYLVLFGCARQYLAEIEEIMNQSILAFPLKCLWELGGFSKRHQIMWEYEFYGNRVAILVEN
jgi:hypothetical protein